MFYGHDLVPEPGEPVAGGTGKFQRLAQRFPNTPARLHAPLSGLDVAAARPRPLLCASLDDAAARRRQPETAIAYPGWAGDADGGAQRPLTGVHCSRPTTSSTRAAFCKQLGRSRSSESRAGSWEILYNAVDVERFTPPAAPPAGGPVLLLGGDQTQAYRLEVALRTLAALPRGEADRHRPARLGPGAADARASDSAAASSSSAATPSATRRDAHAPRASAPCTPRSTTRARSRHRGDGLRTACRLSGQRRHGRARRRRGRASASRTRTAGSATCRPPPEALAEAVDRLLGRARPTRPLRGEARRRAVCARAVARAPRRSSLPS